MTLALTHALGQAKHSEAHLMAQYAVTLVLATSATLKEALRLFCEASAKVWARN